MEFDLKVRAREGCKQAGWLCKGDLCPDCKRVVAAVRDTLKAAEETARGAMGGQEFSDLKSAAWGLMDLGAKEAADAIGRMGEGKGAV